jgi:hypothetical protein
MPFKKGNPGGPGRPKKEVCIPDILRKIGQEEIGPEDKRIKLEAWLQKVYLLAIEGESWASNFIADRTEGKAVQQIVSEVDNRILVEREIVDGNSSAD